MSLSDRRRVLVPPYAKPLIFTNVLASAPLPNSGKKRKTRSAKSPNQGKFFIRTSILADEAAAIGSNSGNNNGSCYLEHDEHKVLVTVTGPKPIKGSFNPSGKLIVDVKFLPFSSDSGSVQHGGGGGGGGGGGSTGVEKTLSDYVFASIVPSVRLERYPKSGITLSILVISGPPGKDSLAVIKQVAAAAVTASSLALVDAGVEVWDVVTASVVNLDDDEDDDDESQEQDRNETTGLAVVSYMGSRNEISGFWIDEKDGPGNAGAATESIQDVRLVQVLEQGTQAALSVRKLVNNVLARKLTG
ncbi:3' exoribonuclease family, domain 1-domain-containing protein [Lipomyces japonicus]|uniref:3' exoribonuclease family, domain 1-domain-containing protein n=1 Tax=Lipomyces japonicus TaxID=56871 RepID=UPI0034CF62B0